MSNDRASLQHVARRLVPRPLRQRYWQVRVAIESHRIRTGRRHEPLISKALKQHIRQGDICVDVGANVGYLTIFMAHLVGPSGRVHAFEAHPDNFRILTGNVARHQMQPRVAAHHAAVADGSRDRVTLYAGRGSAPAEWNIRGCDVDGRPTAAQFEVPAVSLDGCLPETQRVDLVKIDVEGAESQVLDGMRGILERWSPTLLVECHSDDNWTHCSLLADYGYELRDMRGSMINPDEAGNPGHFIAVRARAHCAAG